MVSTWPINLKNSNNFLSDIEAVIENKPTGIFST